MGVVMPSVTMGLTRFIDRLIDLIFAMSAAAMRLYRWFGRRFYSM
jgi:hypothetical protein